MDMHYVLRNDFTFYMAYRLQINYKIASRTVHNQIISYAAFKIIIKSVLSFRPPQVLTDSFHTCPNKLILMGKLTGINPVLADTFLLY